MVGRLDVHPVARNLHRVHDCIRSHTHEVTPVPEEKQEHEAAAALIRLDKDGAVKDVLINGVRVPGVMHLSADMPVGGPVRLVLHLYCVQLDTIKEWA